MKPEYDEETCADVKHKSFVREVYEDFTMLVVCLMQIFFTMLNTLLNVMKKPTSASLWFPMLKTFPHVVPIIQEKLLTMADSIKMDLAEDVVVDQDQTASADKFMVL